MKHLACRLAVEPLYVHVFMRNGRDEDGNILDRKMVGKLAEVRQYLQQTQQTFEAVKARGELTFQEVCHDKPVEDCMNDYLSLLQQEEPSPCLMRLENDVWDKPWAIPGDDV